MGICDFLEKLLDVCKSPPQVKWTLGPFTESTGVGQPSKVHKRKRKVDMALILKDSQKFSAGVKYVTAKGNPAPVDGVPEWSVSDPTILSVEPAADGMSAEVKAIGPLGSCQVSNTADADLGEGTKSIIGTLDVDVVAGEAVAAVIEAGAPSEQV